MGEVKGLSEIRGLSLALLSLKILASVEVRNDSAHFLYLVENECGLLH